MRQGQELIHLTAGQRVGAKIAQPLVNSLFLIPREPTVYSARSASKYLELRTYLVVIAHDPIIGPSDRTLVSVLSQDRRYRCGSSSKRARKPACSKW